MTIDLIFSKMKEGKKVKITPSFRNYWGSCSGVWFDIMAINADLSAHLQDAKHQSYIVAKTIKIIKKH